MSAVMRQAKLSENTFHTSLAHLAAAVRWAESVGLAESMELHCERDDKLRVELAGRFPMLSVPRHLKKGHRDRLLPISPEFAE